MARTATVIVTARNVNNKKPVKHSFKVYESQHSFPFEGNGKYLNIIKDGESWKYMDVRFHSMYEFKSTVTAAIRDALSAGLEDICIDFKEDTNESSDN